MDSAMRILIACEESQIVTKAFRERGHEAYSCDKQKHSGGHPEWHIKRDVLEILDDGWDMMIGFPRSYKYMTTKIKKSETIEELLEWIDYYKKTLEVIIYIYGKTRDEFVIKPKEDQPELFPGVI
jgi:hypothetical protein